MLLRSEASSNLLARASLAQLVVATVRLQVLLQRRVQDLLDHLLNRRMFTLILRLFLLLHHLISNRIPCLLLVTLCRLIVCHPRTLFLRMCLLNQILALHHDYPLICGR